MVTRRKRKQYVLVASLGVGVLVVGAGTFALVRSFLNSAPNPPQKVIQEIHLVRPPPPPPDVPPPPPPPEEKVTAIEPEQKPDTPTNDPPPNPNLGLDTEGGAGGDAFGLIGNKGGRELLAAGGSAYNWYAGLLKSEILDQLNNEKLARHGDYTVTVRVWVRGDGTVERINLVQGSGNRDRDVEIQTALARITRLPQAPPADMPEPVSLRIVSRG